MAPFGDRLPMPDSRNSVNLLTGNQIAFLNFGQCPPDRGGVTFIPETHQASRLDYQRHPEPQGSFYAAMARQQNAPMSGAMGPFSHGRAQANHVRQPDVHPATPPYLQSGGTNVISSGRAQTPLVFSYQSHTDTVAPSHAQTTVPRPCDGPSWRQQERRPQPQDVRQARTVNPYSRLQGLDENKSTVITKYNCLVGLIFMAAVHEQDYMDGQGGTSTTDEAFDRHTTSSRWGNIYTKKRWLIVVAMCENHYVTVPLYTHNDNGLRFKSERAKMEHVSIRDRRHINQFEQLSGKPTLNAEMLPNSQVLSLQSTAHLTYPVTRKYGLRIEAVGRLEKRSRDDLVDMYLDAQRMVALRGRDR